jgi:predicted membrane-bound mannosyltransferase/DNA-binding beta-propeller fold protein YncE
VSAERRHGWAEAAAWTVLLLLNVATHFAGLGERALSHDESLHAHYAHVYATTGVYQHDPMMHGPLLFHVGALAFLLLGATDGTARIVPALAGVLLAVSPLAFRRSLGRHGALAAGALLTLSPTVLFYGRYMRNDVLAALFAVAWVLGAMRYLETRRRGWLALMVAAMALDFACKEVSFLFGATIGSWFAGQAAWRRWRLGERWADSRSGELAVVMLTLVLPFACPLGHLALGHDPTDSTSAVGQARTARLAAAFFLLAVALAWAALRRRPAAPPGPPPLRFGEWARLMAGFWGLQVVLYSSLFTNVRQGLSSGVAGSMGYWLEQHDVGRAGQPWFYYLMLLALYEFLPALLALAAAVLLASRRWTAPAPRRRFVAFCLFWGLASAVLYSVAGEKMPWLLFHITLPLCLAGGALLGWLAGFRDWRGLPAVRGLLLLGAVPAAAVLLLPLLHLRPFQGRDLVSVAATNRWLLHAAAALAVLGAAWRLGRRVGRGPALRLAALGTAGVLALATARYAALLTFVNFDLATDLLVYAHGTPDIKRAMREIDEVAERTGAGAGLVIAYDDDSAWPLTWYLRVYPNQRFYADRPHPEAMSAPVVLVGSKNFDLVAPFLERDYVRRDYRLVWWPIEDYGPAGFTGLFEALRDPARRERLRQVVFHRRYPDANLAQWPYRHEFRLYLRRDLAAQTWPLGLEALRAAAPPPVPTFPAVDCEPRGAYTGPYAGLPLEGPTGIAVGPAGQRVIADTGNHRVVVLDAKGVLVRILGSQCELSRGGAGGCVDPDGAGPLQEGDGQLQEPWGVAAGPQGEVAVADTWNGRIQVFDERGRFARAWGRLDLENPGSLPPDRLYGPRGLAADTGGDRLIVADTGHKRILVFGWDGAFRAEAGGGGVALGRFEEPVGVAVGPGDGAVYVADTWNRRVQRLEGALAAVQEWPVPAWEGRGAMNKPYLAVDGEGRVYASDPERSRVIVMTRDGQPLAAVSAAAWRSDTRGRPTGLALDPSRRELLVADPATDRVWVLPDFASGSCGEPR